MAPGIKAYCAGNGLTIFGCGWVWLGDSHEAIASVGILIGVVVTVIGFIDTWRNNRKGNE